MLYNQSLALLMLGSPMGARIAPELRPEGPDQKSAPTTLISMKNWGGRVGNSSLKWQIGRGTCGQMCFSIRIHKWLKIAYSFYIRIYHSNKSQHAFHMDYGLLSGLTCWKSVFKLTPPTRIVASIQNRDRVITPKCKMWVKCLLIKETIAYVLSVIA